MDAQRARLKKLLSEREIPLTPNQLSLWAWEQLEPGHPALTLSSEWDIKKAPSDLATRLQEALRLLTQRHVTLRTVFPKGPHGPRQEVVERELDFREQQVAQGELAGTLERELSRPFDLESEHPLRVRLFREGSRTRLVLQVHHIVSDWWSMLVLVENLATYLQGRTPPPLKVDFPTYARTQAAWLQGQEAARLLAEWSQTLASPRWEPRFPCRRPRPAPTRAESLQLEIDHALLDRLKARQRDGETSLSAVLLAAYGEALGRLFGLPDITVAVPSGARWRSALRDLVAPLYNILPVRLNLDRAPFPAHVARVLSEAQRRQELPFPTLVEHLNPRRTIGMFPFTGAALSVLPYHPTWTTLEAPGLRAEHIPRQFLVGPFDFTLNVLDAGEKLWASLQYNQNLFEPGQAERLAQLTQESLEAQAAGRRFYQTLTVPTERVEQRFREVALRYPERIALLDEESRLTYAELDILSDRFAALIPEPGNSRPVGLLTEPSRHSVSGWLAILKAGHICLPLDPGLPEGRLRAKLEDSGCRLMLTTTVHRHRLQGIPHILLDQPPPARETTSPLPSAPSDQPCYLLYTSGSLGKPKGVLGTHRGLLHRVDALDRLCPWQPEERVLLRTPIGFVDAVTEWFAALNSGATLCPFPSAKLVDPEAVLRACRSYGVTRITLVPSLLGMLLRSRSAWPETLRVCLSSGEVLRPDLVKLFYQRTPGDSVLLNLYGSTESAGDATWFDTRHLEGNAADVPLGWPLGHNEVLVLDEQGQPVEDDRSGEIHIAGPGLAHGYWNRPEEGEAAFLPAAHGGRRLLATGDRGKWSRGVLHYLGREDRQRKIRGWRVDLQEVEAVLESHPGVKEAAVESREGQLVAWLAAEGDVDSASLWADLRDRLPSSMVPSRLYHVEALPRLVTGKVDRGGLEAMGTPEREIRAQAREEANPTPEREGWERLATLWGEVLDRHKVGLHDDFFELGGHSLSAVELVERIEREFGVSLHAGILMEAPTVADLWAHVHQGEGTGPLVTLAEGGDGPLLFLLPGAWGGTIGFHKLLGKLEPTYPVVGLEYAGLGKDDRRSIKTMAQAFVREIREAYPEGPYRILGFSMGGLLAHEMCRELGDAVDHLVLLDAYGPHLEPAEGVRWGNRLKELWTHLQILARSRPQHVIKRLSSLPTRLQAPPSELYDQAVEYMASQWEQTASSYRGPATLIKLTHQPDWVLDPQLGWGRLLPQMESRTVVGLHGPLVLEEPVVNEVARELQDLLNPERV